MISVIKGYQADPLLKSIRNWWLFIPPKVNNEALKTEGMQGSKKSQNHPDTTTAIYIKFWKPGTSRIRKRGFIR
jgi:hypothetical protein